MTTPDIVKSVQLELGSNLPALSIRLETADDAEWIEALHDACFGPGRFARAAFRIRERFGVVDHLCLVAEVEGTPVATVKMAPINISDQNGFLLGPLATDPTRRKLGAGRALVREVVVRAFEMQTCAFVLLVGDPPYYGPLGFEPTLPERIEFPAPVDPERVLVAAKDATMNKRLNGPISQWVD